MAINFIPCWAIRYKSFFINGYFFIKTGVKLLTFKKFVIYREI